MTEPARRAGADCQRCHVECRVDPCRHTTQYLNGEFEVSVIEIILAATLLSGLVALCWYGFEIRIKLNGVRTLLSRHR